MITILTWFWRQKHSRATYYADDVNRWARMVKRNITIPCRIACVTNQPAGIDDSIEIIPLPKFQPVNNKRWCERKGLPQCYPRLDMFRRDAANTYGERFLCMDLDSIITGNIDSLIDRPEDFVMYSGTSGKRPYNGSMLLMAAGCRPQVYEKFTPEHAEKASRLYVGSDQAWISYALGWLEATWTVDDGVNYWNKKIFPQYDSPPPPDMKILFFCGPTKPRKVISKLHPSIQRAYHV